MSRRRPNRNGHGRPHLRVRRRTPPGASPGTVVVDPKAARPMICAMTFGPEKLTERTVEDLDELADLRGRNPVTWIHVQGLGDAAVLERIAAIYGIHPLALEDVVNTHQRPKVEDYRHLCFIVLRTVVSGTRPETQQLSMFLGSDFVVTFEEGRSECLEPVRQRMRKAQCRIREEGADYLAYALIDTVIDAYFPVLEQYGERLDVVDDQVESGRDRRAIGAIHELREELLLLRRAVWPLRDALSALTREASDLISPNTRLYLRDCLDHTVQLLDLLEAYREICADLRDYYLSAINNRMNEIMKVLTIIATIFIPLSFIASLYGMNFNPEASPYNMPELNWRFGYPFALGVMITVAAFELILFWRRGWLEKD